MDFLSNPNLNNVAALSTTSTKVLVVDGASNTVKYRTPAQIITDAGSSSKYRADFAFSRGDAATGLSIPSSSEPSSGVVVWPFQYASPIGTVFQTTFVPTNYQLTMMLYNDILTVDVPTAIGFKLQYSTNNSTWTDVYSWDIRGSAGYRSTSGSISITGSPANVYYRLYMYNPSFNNTQVVNALGLTLSVWN